MFAELAQAGVRQPPGPRGWPYLGCSNALLRNPMQFWSDIANRYGGIARVPLMRGRVAYLVSDPELLYELLVTNRHRYRKNIRYRAAVELFGDGLLLNEGDAWKRQRLLSQSAFKADHVAAQVPWMAALTAKWLEGWQCHVADQRHCDVDAEFLRLSQLVAGYYFMGEGFEIPFAAGHRNCIGGSLALVEIKLAVAMIAQRYELNLAPGHRVEGAAGTTMYPRYGMKMRIGAI